MFALNFTDHSQILRISIYYASGKIEPSSLNEGQHQRVHFLQGSVGLEDLIQAETAGNYDIRTSEVHELEMAREKVERMVGGMLITGKSYQLIYQCTTNGY